MSGDLSCQSSITLTGLLVALQSAAQSYQRGISRYVRTKQLDDLESYVPLVIEARSQLQKAGNLMGKHRLCLPARR